MHKFSQDKDICNVLLILTVAVYLIFFMYLLLVFAIEIWYGIKGKFRKAEQ